MTPGAYAFKTMMCLYQQDASEFAADTFPSGHLLQVTGRDEGAPRVAMHKHNWVQDEEL